MATLYITEFNHLGGSPDSPGSMPVALLPALAEQTVTIGGSSVQSSAINAQTKFIRLHTDSICSVAFGTNPTATAAKIRMAANQVEYFSVPAGLSWKVAVITNS